MTKSLTLASIKVGQKLRTTGSWGDEWPVGLILTVKKVRSGSPWPILASRDDGYPGDGVYKLEDVEAVETSPIEPRAPMTKAVLDLLRRKGAITQMEAQGVLRCRALPKRISELKELGHKIVRELKVDPLGQRYARYHLMAVA